MATPDPSASSHALLERDDLLDALHRAAREAADGHGRTVLVGGEAGIGKTTLLERFAATLVGGRTLWGGCESLATPRPLGPLLDAAHQASATLRTLVAGPHDRGVVFGAVLDELALGPAPVVLVLEDVHWADDATLDLVKFVGRRIHRIPALLLLSYRDNAASLAKLRPLFGELPAAHLMRIAVPPLTRDAVDALTAASSRVDGAHVFAATGGNPFFVTEVLREGDAHGAVPSTVRDAVLGRAASLDAMPSQLLQWVAIVPRHVDLDLVDEVMAPSTDAIEACLATGLLIADGPRLRFRHELARTAVEESISPPRALQLHARMLAALADRPADRVDLAQLVHHARLANDVDAVLRWAPLAACEAAERGARRQAAAHCRAALAHADRLDDGARALLLDEYASHCFELNDLDAAIPARAEAIELFARRGDVAHQVEALAAQALSLVRALRNAEADLASRRAVELAVAMPPSRLLALAYATESYLRMLNRDIDDAIDAGTTAIALADTFGDRTVLASAHKTVGAARLFVDYQRGCAHLQESLAIGHTLRDGGAAVADAYVMLSSGSGELHVFDVAERWFGEGIAYARAHDLDRVAGYMEGWQALCDVYRGRWTLASERAHAVARREAAGTTNRIVVLVALGRLRIRRGDPGADAVLDEALELALRSNTLQRLAPVATTRAEAAWIAGDRTRAVAEAARVLPLAQQKRHGWYEGELAYWHWQAGAPVEVSNRCAEPFALEMAGRWQDAAAAWDGLGCPFERARALTHGDGDAQREALAAFDALGARPWADAMRRSLRDAGVRGVARGARASTRAHPCGLTTAEMRILALMAEDLANADIAGRLHRSVRTVDHHVAAVLAKVGARTRHEAVRRAEREGWIARAGEREPGSG